MYVYACILTCSDLARRIREVRSPARNSAASNRLQSNAPRKRRPQIRGRRCHDRSNPVGTGTPVGRPGCTVHPASPLCSNTCRRRRRRDRCSSDQDSRLQVEITREPCAIRSSSSFQRRLGAGLEYISPRTRKD